MYQKYYNIPQTEDERFLGGFLGPFILGGITGGVVAPYFWNGNKGNYYNNYYYPYPVPYNYSYGYPYYYYR